MINHSIDTNDKTIYDSARDCDVLLEQCSPPSDRQIMCGWVTRASTAPAEQRLALALMPPRSGGPRQ